MKILTLSVILIGLAVMAMAQPLKDQPASADNIAQPGKPTTATPEISLKDYRDILQNERKVLEEQNQTYYTRIDNLMTQTKWFFGIIGAVIAALLGWTFLKTRNDVREILKVKLEEMGINQMQKELRSVRDDYQKLRQEIDSVTAYRSRQIKWFYAAGCTVPNQSRLEAVGLHNIKPVPVEKGAAIQLTDADLVIVSHEGDQKELGADLYKRILNMFIQERLQTPLVAYTLNNYKLTTEEFGKLGQVELAVPANTQATLVGYVESLLRVGKIQKAL